MAAPRGELPAWADIGLIPLLNLAVALIVAGLVVVIIGESPFEALGILLEEDEKMLKLGAMAQIQTSCIYDAGRRPRLHEIGAARV